jgi:cobalt-zinc-cadmium efflux system protein
MCRSARLWIVVVLNVALVGVLVVIGATAHAVGVLAEGADYVADAAAIGVALVAIWLSSRPPAPRRPHGYPRATTWAALVKAGWLVVLTVLVAAEALRRLASGTERVHGLPVLIASTVAAVAMVAGAVILGADVDDDDDGGGSLNMRAVVLETIADAGIAAAVTIVGAIILATGGAQGLDPAVALLVAGVVAYHALRLLGRVIRILTNAQPPPCPGMRSARAACQCCRQRHMAHRSRPVTPSPLPDQGPGGRR